MGLPIPLQYSTVQQGNFGFIISITFIQTVNFSFLFVSCSSAEQKCLCPWEDVLISKCKETLPVSVCWEGWCSLSPWCPPPRRPTAGPPRSAPCTWSPPPPPRPCSRWCPTGRGASASPSYPHPHSAALCPSLCLSLSPLRVCSSVQTLHSVSVWKPALLKIWNDSVKEKKRSKCI